MASASFQRRQPIGWKLVGNESKGRVQELLVPIWKSEIQEFIYLILEQEFRSSERKLEDENQNILE